MNYAEEKKRMAEIKAMPAATIDELVAKLEACIFCEAEEAQDTEMEHYIADNALLEFINEPRVTDAFNRLPKWYS